MTIPKRTKYRKQQKMVNKGVAHCGHVISFGTIGLQAVTRGRLTEKQIEAARRAINRHIKRTGKMFIRVFADKPFTTKPLEVKMGRGKGNIDYWAMNIQPGKVIYELEGVPPKLARVALTRGAAKLPFRSVVIEKRNDIKVVQV
jgi:large subunit ribosomal protein L16